MLSFLTLTVSAVVVFAALLDPGIELTNSLTHQLAEMIVQGRIPIWVPAPIPGIARTMLRLSLDEGSTDIYLYIVDVMYKLVMLHFLADRQILLYLGF